MKTNRLKTEVELSIKTIMYIRQQRMLNVILVQFIRI